VAGFSGDKKGSGDLNEGATMQELEVTWGRVLSVFWLIFWRGMVGAVIIGAVIGFVIGFAVGLSGAQMNPLVSAIPSGIAGVVWYLAVIRMALKKQYKDFRIVLLTRSA
jgi:hypothetical protein